MPKLISNLLNPRRNQRGVISIEFGIGFATLSLILYMFLELCRFIIHVNMVETALTEINRLGRVDQDMSSYSELTTTMADSDMLWNKIGLDASRMTLNVVQYDSLQALVSGDASHECSDCPVVIYHIGYSFVPFVAFGSSSLFEIDRRMLGIQEHAGW